MYDVFLVKLDDGRQTWFSLLLNISYAESVS